MQYEDGDTEEFVVSELKKQKLLQLPGPEDRTDFGELDRLYAAAQQQWAQGNPPTLKSHAVAGKDFTTRHASMSFTACSVADQQQGAAGKNLLQANRPVPIFVNRIELIHEHHHVD